MTRSFSEALHEISRLALDFQRVTGESIVSRDLFAVVARNGAIFDPNRMTDEWADPRRSKRSVDTRPLAVLCTTQLGLIREEIVRSKAAVEGGDEQWEVTSTVLIKPRVVLTTMLEELQNEQVRARTPMEARNESGTNTVSSVSVPSYLRTLI